MKTLKVVLALTVLALGTSAFADHRGGCNLMEASSLAYQLADIGERYEYSYTGADGLHRAATSLYYALQNQLGGHRYDHREGAHRVLWQLADQVGYQVQNFAYYAPYDLGNWARSLYASLRNHLNC